MTKKVYEYISLFIDKNSNVYFDSFEIEFISPEIIIIKKKSRINQLLKIFLECEIIILSRVDFIVSLS